MRNERMDNMKHLIKICDIEKYYGSGNNITKAVNRVSFQVDEGEFIGIMGASGSGKTTLLNMISTIDRVSAGHIYYGDTDITMLKEEGLAKFRKENLGFVFQEFNLLDMLTIRENIELPMTLQKQKKAEIVKRSRQVMRALGIEKIADKFPVQVSGGQKQRCADEPTGALDSRSAQMLLDTFERMNRKMGATILMVTHDAFSASYCRRILFLKDGQIFHELYRGQETRREFLNQILDVLALTGGECSDAE